MRADAAECERPLEKVPAIEFHSVAPSSIGRRGFVIAVPRRNEQREYRQARLSESTPIIGACIETDGFRLAHFRLFLHRAWSMSFVYEAADGFPFDAPVAAPQDKVQCVREEIA